MTIIFLCFIGLLGLWVAQRNWSGSNGRERGRDDEQDLVANMERTSKTSKSKSPPSENQAPAPPPALIRDDGFKVHYVVPVGPGDDESKRDSSNDFKEIYISTPSSGLQRVERNASSASSSVTTSRSSKSSSPSSSRDDQCCQMAKFDPFLSSVA